MNPIGTNSIYLAPLPAEQKGELQRIYEATGLVDEKLAHALFEKYKIDEFLFARAETFQQKVAVLKKIIEKAQKSFQLEGERSAHVIMLMALCSYSHANSLDHFRNFLDKLSADEKIDLFQLKNHEGQSALHLVVRYGKELSVLELLIDLGAKFTQDHEGMTPLVFAISSKPSLKVFEVLLSKLDQKETERLLNLEDSRNKHTVLDYILHAWRTHKKIELQKIFEFLVSQGARSFHAPNNNSLLHRVIDYTPPIEMVKSIVTALSAEEKEIALNAKNDAGQTVLHIASSHVDNIETIKYLISQGAKYSLDKNLESPLHIAMVKNLSLPTLKALLDSLDPQERKRLLNQKNDRKETPLHLLARVSHAPECFIYLLDQGAALTPDKEGYTPIDIITMHNGQSTHLLMAILDKFSPAKQERLLNHKTKNKEETVLHWLAMQPQSVETTRLLIERGAKFCGNKFGYSPLHIAALKGMPPSVFQALLTNLTAKQKKEALNLRDNNKATAFILLFSEINPKIECEVVDLLINLGAERMLKDNNGDTVLHEALWNHPISKKMIRSLLNGLDREQKNQLLNAKNVRGFSPLHVAITMKRSLGVVKLLIKEGARNQLDCDKNTVIHQALWKYLPYDYFPLLLKSINKKDKVLNISNYEKLRPLDFAIVHRNDPKIIQYLIDNGAKKSLNRLKTIQNQFSQSVYAALVEARSPLEVQKVFANFEIGEEKSENTRAAAAKAVANADALSRIYQQKKSPQRAPSSRKKRKGKKKKKTRRAQETTISRPLTTPLQPTVCTTRAPSPVSLEDMSALQELNQLNAPLQHTLHSRIIRWQVSDLEEIKKFGDHDSRTNKWSYKYAGDTPGELQMHKYCHNLAGIERLLANDHFMNKYSFEQSYFGHMNKCFYAEMDVEGKKELGIIRISYGMQDNIIYHARFEKLNKKEITQQLIRHISPPDDSLKPVDTHKWELTNTCSYDLDANILLMHIGKAAEDRVTFKIFKLR